MHHPMGLENLEFSKNIGAMCLENSEFSMTIRCNANGNSEFSRVTLSVDAAFRNQRSSKSSIQG